MNKREREEGSEKESEREWYGLLVAGRQQGGGGSGEGESEEREKERGGEKCEPSSHPSAYIYPIKMRIDCHVSS